MFLDNQIGFESFYSVVVFDKNDKCLQARTFYSLLEALSFQKVLRPKYSENYTIEVYRFDSVQVGIEKGSKKNDN